MRYVSRIISFAAVLFSQAQSFSCVSQFFPKSYNSDSCILRCTAVKRFISHIFCESLCLSNQKGGIRIELYTAFCINITLKKNTNCMLKINASTFFSFCQITGLSCSKQTISTSTTVSYRHRLLSTKFWSTVDSPDLFDRCYFMIHCKTFVEYATFNGVEIECVNLFLIHSH